MIENYVGIDVSKLSFDVFVRENSAHKQFKNESVGFELFTQWLKKQVFEYSIDLFWTYRALLVAISHVLRNRAYSLCYDSCFGN